MKQKLASLSLAALALASAASAQSYAPADGAVLRTLDKITGRSADIEVGLDAPVKFGALIVNMKACYRTPPEEPPESAAFLQIFSQQAEQETAESPVLEVSALANAGDPLFSGWMFASSPGLSALEHPVYDVWVIRCNAPEPTMDEFGDEEEAADAPLPEEAEVPTPVDNPDPVVEEPLESQDPPREDEE